MDGDAAPAAQVAAMRRLHRVVAELNAARDLGATLRAVVDGVVSSLGYEIAAVAVIRPDGDVEIAAIAGACCTTGLVGLVGERATWDAMLANGDAWGPLRFVKYQIWPDDIDPDAPLCDEEDIWHPLDGLLAPLRTPEGELVGVLSVDKPAGGRAPMPWQDELLEVFATQAAIAIDNARLHAETLAAIERFEAERCALRASEESFRQMFDSAPTAMALVGLHDTRRDRLIRVNDVLCGLLGYSGSALRERTFAELVRADDRAGLDQIAGDCVELRLQRGDGSVVWVSVRTRVIVGALGEPEVRLVHIENVDDRRRREQHLQRLASRDALTGLANRNEVHSRLGHALASGQGVALFFCDLDDFKAVNDRYGHGAGDAVLVEVGLRLRAEMRPDDVVARVGGDEFVVMACDLAKADAHRLAARLCRSLARPLDVGNSVIHPSASIGIGWVAAGAGITADTLLASADRQMYRRKRARRTAVDAADVRR